VELVQGRGAVEAGTGDVTFNKSYSNEDYTWTRWIKANQTYVESPY
jgi:hypothetical protein